MVAAATFMGGCGSTGLELGSRKALHHVWGKRQQSNAKAPGGGKETVVKNLVLCTEESDSEDRKRRIKD